jgi:hypothetical protein
LFVSQYEGRRLKTFRRVAQTDLLGPMPLNRVDGAKPQQMRQDTSHGANALNPPAL